jgi:uncharacterized protein (DUF2141 family)
VVGFPPAAHDGRSIHDEERTNMEQRFRTVARRYVLGGLLAGAASVGVAAAADLRVTVDNVADDEGQVMVGLFSVPADFPKRVGQGQAVRSIERRGGKVTVIFTGLQAGRFAVSAFHDRDANGKLDTNLVGMPVEPFGFSNGASANFGPPAFGDAAIDLPAQGTAIVVTLK